MRKRRVLGRVAAAVAAAGLAAAGAVAATVPSGPTIPRAGAGIPPGAFRLLVKMDVQLGKMATGWASNELSAGQLASRAAEVVAEKHQVLGDLAHVFPKGFVSVVLDLDAIDVHVRIAELMEIHAHFSHVDQPRNLILGELNTAVGDATRLSSDLRRSGAPTSGADSIANDLTTFRNDYRDGKTKELDLVHVFDHLRFEKQRLRLDVNVFGPHFYEVATRFEELDVSLAGLGTAVTNLTAHDSTGNDIKQAEKDKQALELTLHKLEHTLGGTATVTVTTETSTETSGAKRCTATKEFPVFAVPKGAAGSYTDVTPHGIPRSAKHISVSFIDKATGQPPGPEVFPGQTWSVEQRGFLPDGRYDVRVNVSGPGFGQPDANHKEWEVVVKYDC